MGVGGMTQQPTGWLKQIGTLAHVSAGDDGEIWGITAARQIRRWNDGQWQPVPGSLKQLSVGSAEHIWGVDDSDRIFRWYGDWQEMPGRLCWVSAASDGTVVGVAADDTIHRWNGHGWDLLEGSLMRVSVANQKVIYGYNRASQIFRWNGGGWDFRGGEARGALSVGVRNGSSHLWACLVSASRQQVVSALSQGLIGSERVALFEAVDNGDWQDRDGMLTQFSAAAQFVVGVNAAGEVYSWGYPLPGVNRPLVTRQRGWRWCAKCQGMFFGGNTTQGRCASRPPKTSVAAIVPHNSTGSSDYVLATSAGAPGQSGWRWCHKCEALFWGGGFGGKCPAGDKHDGSQSATYTLVHNDAAAPGQEGWRYCKKCEGLFFSGGGETRCPAGAAHDGSASGAYKVQGIA